MLRAFISRRIGWGFRAGFSMPLRDLLRARPRAAFAKPPGADFVYVITDGHGMAKVGCSNDPRARLAQLQATHPAGPLWLSYCAAVRGDARRVERATHHVLVHRRQGGEWFHATTEMAIAAIAAGAHRAREAIVSIEPALIDQVVRAANAPPRPRHSFRNLMMLFAACTVVFWFILTALMH